MSAASSAGVKPAIHVIGNLVATYLADPSEQGRLAMPCRELAYCLDERRLRDFLARLLIAAESRKCERIDPRKMQIEERREGALLSGQHRAHEIALGARILGLHYIPALLGTPSLNRAIVQD